MRYGATVIRRSGGESFAVLNVTSGKVTGRHYKRRRHLEFLDFMNQVVADYPEQEIRLKPCFADQ